MENLNLFYNSLAVLVLVIGLVCAIQYIINLHARQKDLIENVVFLKDLAKFWETEAKSWKELASFDPLTGLLNRRGLENVIASLNGFKSRHDDENRKHQLLGGDNGLLVMDLDHFKSINDTYGHDVGDQVLCLVAHTLRNSFRQSDVIARIGGEEIAVFLPYADAKMVAKLAEIVRCAVARIKVPGIDDLTVTVSIGAVVLQQQNMDLGLVIKQADQVMYLAKEGGRDMVVFRQIDAAGNVYDKTLAKVS